MTDAQTAILALIPEGQQITTEAIHAGAQHISRRTLDKHLGILIERGYLRRVSRQVGRNRLYHYALTPAGMKEKRAAGCD